MLFRNGLDIKVGGSPRQSIEDCQTPETVGLLGSDYPGLHLKAEVSEGQVVAAGDVVLRDRSHPEIVIVAPVSGRIETIEIGARRRVSLVTIRREAAEQRSFQLSSEPGGAERFLQETGIWTALVQRPFGRVPLPGTRPDAIFVTATDTEPNAPDPAQTLNESREDFARGVGLLARLTDGPVFVCQTPGAPLVDGTQQIRTAFFGGAHPEGLAGTHIDRIFPCSFGRRIWQIGYADVVAIGCALRTGHLPATRVIALGGPMACDPRLVRLPIGADIAALVAQEAWPGPRRVLSGSAISGEESRFLRRRHLQITLLPRSEPPLPSRWHLPPAKRRPLIPHAAIERALGPRLPTLPLLRALSVKDVAQAERLGVLGLLEEDLALATYLSGGSESFGERLRDVLDELEPS